MTTEDIERIVKLIGSTSDEDVKTILKKYLAWNLMAPPVPLQEKPPGSIHYL